MRPLKNRFFGQCLRDTVSPWLSDWGRPGPILQPFEGFLLGPNCVPWRIVRCFSQNDKDFLHTGSQSGAALGPAVVFPYITLITKRHTQSRPRSQASKCQFPYITLITKRHTQSRPRSQASKCQFPYITLNRVTRCIAPGPAIPGGRPCVTGSRFKNVNEVK